MQIQQQSLPQKPQSTQTHTLSTPPSSRTQTMEDLISDKINNQTYEFEPDVVARMLSPKIQKPGNIRRPFLKDFTYLIDQPDVKTALEQLPQREPLAEHTGWNTNIECHNYAPLVDFLNKCVEDCNVAYDCIHNTLDPTTSRFKVNARDERWLRHLCFKVYNRMTGDGIQGARPLKPDCVGLNSEKHEADSGKLVCWWSLSPGQKGQNDLSIIVPIEVKEDWRKMVTQSGIYARIQFAASPLRCFTLAIAFDYKQLDLRYLIFHHGGLSASKRLNLKNPSHCCSIRQILLSVLLWQSDGDAGFPSFTDSHRFHLPDHDEWEIQQVLYHALSVRGRNTFVAALRPPPSDTLSANTDTESMATKLNTDISVLQQMQNAHSDSCKRSVEEATLDHILHDEKRPRSLVAVKPNYVVSGKPVTSLPTTVVVKCSWPNAAKEELEPRMYAACKDAFGTPKFLKSFVPNFRGGYPMCNSIFLPSPGEDLTNYHWNVFNHNEERKPKAVDCRALWITVLENQGQHLDECLDARDLSECVLHSMLGWLSAYQRGYLHRDISIGNLLKLMKPAPCQRFNALEVVTLLYKLLSSDQQTQLGQPDLDDLTFTTASPFTVDDSERKNLLAIAKELDTLVNQCGLATECKAILTDGDMAAYIDDYLDSPHNMRVFSGTSEFMSIGLLFAIKYGESYLQSPLDDLWSFFWTTLWAILFNNHHPGQTKEERIWRDKLCQGFGSRDAVANVIEIDPTISRIVAYSPILRKMAPILRKWRAALTTLTSMWLNEKFDALNKDSSKVDYLILFHKVAYTGVRDFVLILKESGILE